MGNTPDWGEGFPASEVGLSLSNRGHEMGWYIAGYKEIGGERQDLENESSRVLTDAELQNADYLVVHFVNDPLGYKTFTSGPWEDWEELWIDMVEFYDEY